MITIPNYIFDYSLIIICVFYILAIINGVKNGFMYILLDILGFIIAIFGAYYLTPIFSETIMLIPSSFISAEYSFQEGLRTLFNNILLFFLIFMLLLFCINILKKVFIRISDLPIIGTFNKLLGGLCGIIIGTFWVILFTMVLKSPLFVNGEDFIEQTALKNISTVSDQAINMVFTNYLTDEKLISFVEDANQNNSNDNIFKIIEMYYTNESSNNNSQSKIIALLNSDNCNILLEKLANDEEFVNLVKNNSEIDLDTLITDLKATSCQDLDQNADFISLIDNPTIATYLEDFLDSNVSGGDN